jgi:hypothetical protein
VETKDHFADTDVNVKAKAEAVPLHALEALWVRESIAHTLS